MAEIRQLDVGVRPRAGGWALRLFRSLNIWFWAIVGLPTLIAGVYYFAIASDLYVSETRFMVRSPKQVETSPIGALLQTTGLGRATEDTAAVQDFIMSRDAVRKLEEQNQLRAVLGRPDGDLVTRFPGILFWRKDFEALFARYDHFVSVKTSTTGVTTLAAKAYLPEDAHMLASALLSYSEQLVNELNERAHRDALDTARHEVDRTEERIAQIQSELAAYRVKQKMIDPKSASSGVLELIEQMKAAQTNARAQLGELLNNSPNSPQIPLVKTRIASLDKLIAEERAKLSGATDSVVAALTEYERLTLQRELAEKALTQAFASLEAARVEAQRQQIYLETIAQPNLPDYPLYPKRIVSFLTVVVSCCLAYGIARLLVANAREHAAACLSLVPTVPKFWEHVAAQWRVVGALLIREIYTRFGREGLGFAWIIAEPLIFAIPVLLTWSVVRGRFEHGVPMMPFLWTGYMPLLLFRHVGGRMLLFVRVNAGLLYHRQVTIFDIFLARFLLEVTSSLTAVLTSLVLFYSLGLLELPRDLPTFYLGYLYIIWWCAVVGLIVGALSERTDWAEKLWLPYSYLYIFFGGAFWMGAWLPETLRGWALLQPSVQAYELIRAGMFGNVVPTYGDPAYLTAALAVLTLIGLLLMRDARKYVIAE